MHKSYSHSLSLVAFSVLVLLVSCQGGTSPGAETGGEAMANMEGMESQGQGMEEHSDHETKHGGIFFMALDEVHHLEGALSSPGMFRVYLYDAMTMPLNDEQMQKASGALHWGEFPDPPGIPLKVGHEEGVLMAELEREVEFPATLTLFLNLPGAAEGESELFNFVFDEYSHAPDSHESEDMDHGM